MSKDMEKINHHFLNLPITELICIMPGGRYNNEEIETASEMIVKRQQEVVSYFQQIEPQELFTSVFPVIFLKYNPAAFVLLKKVFIERKEEILKQVGLMDDLSGVMEKQNKEIEECLLLNIEWPTAKQRYELEMQELQNILEVQDPKKHKIWKSPEYWRGIIKKRWEDQINKLPKKLNEVKRRVLEEQIIKNKSMIDPWYTQVKPIILQILGVETGQKR